MSFARLKGRWVHQNQKYEKPVWGRLHGESVGSLQEWAVAECCWLSCVDWQYKPVDVSAEFVCVLTVHMLLLNEEWETAVNILRKAVTGYVQFIQHIYLHLYWGLCQMICSEGQMFMYSVYSYEGFQFCNYYVCSVGGIKKNNLRQTKNWRQF